MISAFLFFFYLIVGVLLMAAVAFGWIDANEPSKATPVSRLIAFFLFPWVAILMALLTLFDEDGTSEDLWEYLVSLTRFVWLGDDDFGGDDDIAG